MRCPFCSENRDRVVDSRESRDGATIRRRRECLSCGRRFTSYEQIEDIPYMVVKHDGTREEFSRKKLLGGLLKACEKRPIPLKKLEAIVDETESMLTEREDREISTQEIGAFVMERLQELDQVAYVRFASVYRRFEDIDAFMDVVKSLLTAAQHRPRYQPKEGVVDGRPVRIPVPDLPLPGGARPAVPGGPADRRERPAPGRVAAAARRGRDDGARSRSSPSCRAFRPAT